MVDTVVNRAHLSKVLIDGGSALNIIFKDTLEHMGFNISELAKAEEPFFGIIPGTVSIPMGRVTFKVTFGTRENYRIESLNFEVADFQSSYHAIFGRPMLAKFMAIPNHTYLVLKMPAPKGVLSIRGDLKVCHDCHEQLNDMALVLEDKIVAETLKGIDKPDPLP